MRTFHVVSTLMLALATACSTSPGASQPPDAGVGAVSAEAAAADAPAMVMGEASVDAGAPNDATAIPDSLSGPYHCALMTPDDPSSYVCRIDGTDCTWPPGASAPASFCNAGPTPPTRCLGCSAATSPAGAPCGVFCGELDCGTCPQGKTCVTSPDPYWGDGGFCQ